MIKKRYTAAEIICVILLLGFIVFLFIWHSGETKKTAEELASPVLEITDASEMTRKSEEDAAEAFGFDLSKTEGVVYYRNDNIMDVSELLIVKLNDKTDSDEFKSAVESYVADRKNLYKNYAPQQFALLENCIIDSNGNTLFYCTSKNAEKYYKEFKSNL